MKPKSLNTYSNIKLISASFVAILLVTSILTISTTITSGYPNSPLSADKNTLSTNKDKSELSKIPDSVKQFILNQIVNKSKADSCCRICRSEWYKIL